MNSTDSNADLKSIDRSKNNFDLLRLIAALLVLFSHAIDQVAEKPREIIYTLTKGKYVLSTFGLIIFFTISGYLVTQSLYNSSSLKQFVWKRFLRIYPAFIVLTILTVFVLGPFFTTLSLKAYFTHFKTYSFLFTNLLIINRDVSLPGVFHEAPVNASAWTIPMEIKFYLILLLLYILTFLQRRIVITVLFILFVAIKLFLPEESLSTYSSIGLGFYYYGFFFMTGVLLFIWKDKIKLSILGILICAALWLLSYILHLPGKGFEELFFAYTFLWLGLKTPHIPFPKQDISYSIYIYAFPIQMMLTQLTNGNLSFWPYNAISLPLIVLCSYLSWHFVEKKALAKKYLVK